MPASDSVIDEISGALTLKPQQQVIRQLESLNPVLIHPEQFKVGSRKNCLGKGYFNLGKQVEILKRVKLNRILIKAFHVFFTDGFVNCFLFNKIGVLLLLNLFSQQMKRVINGDLFCMYIRD
ncbi:hypothetical protein BIT28_00535 [Photobacterium proteolyticum]|uniref:Uncharacterized protein n=2 Tax=Photobacterium proteolyticum TaxID=1903952 RepID=A0A1Q9GWZ4_9GAMM|nr:hypothetical protein BIT28_00535 [Photobacterium proteolyticum]